MKKSIKLLAGIVATTALAAGLQVTSLAAVNSASSNVTSSHVASSQASSLNDNSLAANSAHSSLPATSSHASSLLADEAKNDLTRAEATPYKNDIPNTGAEGFAIPGAVAILAASAAAIALTGKKK